MKSYQSVLILKPDLEEKQVEQSLQSVTAFIKKGNGSCLKVENWGKKRLGYRVRKNRFGIYLNIYHTCESLKISALENEYKLFDPIIKFMVLKLDEKELARAMERSDDGQEKKEPDKDTDDDDDKADDVDEEADA